MKALRAVIAASFSLLCLDHASAQILISSGTYTQNFDTLSTNTTSSTWTDNTTLPGWYASRTLPVGTTNVTTYIGGAGASTTGSLYSFGPTNVQERALGSLASGTPGNFAYGVRISNDTATPQALMVSYTGEQWRNGGNTAAQKLEVSYLVGTGLTSADATNSQIWTAVTALDFVSPFIGSTAAPADGNASTNRVVFSNVLVSGVSVLPGEEIFLRWYDYNDPGNDHGLAIDNLSISFIATNAISTPPSITKQPTNTTVVQGNTATFTVTAGGTAPLSYQWYFTDINNPIGAGTATLTLPYVNTSMAGNYFVIVSNAVGFATSQVATLSVTLPPPAIVTNIAYLRTLMDSTNFAPSDTTNLYTVEGIVTTYTNLTTPTNTQFFIQQSNHGIVIFESGGTIRPSAGDLVRVTGPLGAFNGVFEMNLHISNANHAITILSSGNTLPDAVPFDFATANNVALMESSIEGKRVYVSNVFLQAAGDPSGFVVPSTVNITNINGEIFTLRVDGRVIDMAAQSIPENATLIGVMGQFKSSAPFTNGYQLFVTRYADVVPTVPSVPVEITKTSTNTTVSWSSIPTGFTLQSTASLSPTNWQDVVTTPVTTTNKNIITITPTGTGFYRTHGMR